MTETLEITFNPNQTQKAFIESQAKADLFSSRMGEGKSAALAWSTFYHTMHNPGATWAVVRDTWENLRRSTLEEFFKWFPPGIFGTWHATNKEFTWASGVADGKVIFLGMDAPDDASKLMSVPLGGLAIDEPAPAIGSSGVDEMVFDIGMSRLRQTGKDGKPFKWYGVKLAENNPDENHWTYRRFVNPGEKGFMLWQPPRPENVQNLRADYYADLRNQLRHRPDLVRRFVEGEFGFQQVGKQVTPQWNDRLHLALGLGPTQGRPLHILWDFGHNPTAIITQLQPMGYWYILDAIVGDGIGAAELIEDGLKPLLVDRYGFALRGHRQPYDLVHIGDPAGETGDQTSIRQSPVKLIRHTIGGIWRKGPVKIEHRVEPLRKVLTKTILGTGLVQVDRIRAKAVWHAMRGGWHYHVARTGITSHEPFKDIHSHPGDAMGYGAAVLFPLAKLDQSTGRIALPKETQHFGHGSTPAFIGKGPMPGGMPKHGAPLDPTRGGRIK